MQENDDSSFWPLSRELFRSIPPDAALSMLDPSLGDQPWVADVPDDPEFRGVPPPRTFTINFPSLPVDDVIDQPLDDEGNPQMVRLSCPSLLAARIAGQPTPTSHLSRASWLKLETRAVAAQRETSACPSKWDLSRTIFRQPLKCDWNLPRPGSGHRDIEQP